MDKRGKNMKKLEMIMDKLVKNETLEKRHHDHHLIGQYNHRRECHVENDWLLIYKIENGMITFERTGTHADLF